MPPGRGTGVASALVSGPRGGAAPGTLSCCCAARSAALCDRTACESALVPRRLFSPGPSYSNECDTTRAFLYSATRFAQWRPRWLHGRNSE